MRRLALTACLVTLAACSRPGPTALSSAGEEAVTGSPVQTEASRDTAAQVQSPRPASEPTPPPAISAPLLAYAYGYAVEAPAGRVPGLLASHEAACAAAGPAVCQMTGSSVDREGRDQVRASLSLRAAPAWIARFRSGLADQMSKVGGRVAGATVESEDLTRQIVDNEAALRAKTTLRDRLQAILATRPGKVSELLEVEQALAAAQGEIDARQSELAVMRTRVQTSALTVTYRSSGALAPEGVASPLARAAEDFVGILVITLALMVRAAAWLLPWALAAALIWWLLRKRLPHFTRRPKAPPPPPPPVDADAGAG